MTGDRAARRGSPESLSALGRVMGELVHDLSNEVAALQGWAALARGEAEGGRVAATELDRVLEISNRLGSILQDTLATVSGQPLSPEVVFDPRKATEETVASRVRAGSRVTVRLHLALRDEVRVAGRESFWSRALGNLLINAERHARTEVRVSLGTATLTRRWVVLRVEDDGPGIPEHARSAVFLPLWRGEGGGAGLGLSAVAWSVAQLGGEVAYRDDSLLGGAAFELRVPVAEPLAQRVATRTEVMSAFANRKILVVDDDAMVRDSLARLLRRAGALVRELDPSGEPEERLLQAMLTTLPDLVLLDLRMGGRGGVSLWRRMCRDTPTLAAQVVFMSGAAPGEEDWNLARHTGRPLIGKPFDLLHLAQLVGRCPPAAGAPAGDPAR